MGQLVAHEALASLAFLIGMWRGEGRGTYPNISDFAYSEETTFWHSGKPWLGYLQRTWSLEDHTPMHSEAGYWRPVGDGHLEIVLAHAFGVTEVLEGTVRGTRIEAGSTSVVATPSAKRVSELARTFDVSGNTLTYEVAMAYGDVPLQRHLGAELRRVDST